MNIEGQRFTAPCRTKMDPNGFTLMEILIAIVIFGIVAATVFASYRAIFDQTEQMESDASRYAMAKNCLDRMVMDLSALYVSVPPFYTPTTFNEEPDPFRLVSEEGSGSHSKIGQLQFTSREHLPMGGDTEKGIARIVYYEDEARDQKPFIRRSDNLYPFKEFEKNENDPVLCKEVLSLTFTFKDAESENHETWDSESRQFKFATPRAVGIHLEVGEKDRAVILSTQVTLPLFRDETEEK
jgi:general secretion pathway protein J